VLGNDTDVEGDALTAILVSNSSNGTLSFNPNGSFTYTPHSNTSGTDSFTYRANDGSADSNVAMVTITVTATPTPTPMPSPTPAIIEFSQPNYPVAEGAGSALITVTRSGDTSTAVSVEYTTSDSSELITDETEAVAKCGRVTGVALSRCDFNTTLGTLRFAAGEISKVFTVLLTDDSYVEGPEAAD